MKIFLQTCLMIVAIAVPTFAQSMQQQSAAIQSDSAAIAKLMNDWNNAFLTNDVKTLDRIIANDYIVTNVDGSVNTKEQELAPFRTASLKFDTASLDEFTVTLYGTMAIVRGIGTWTVSRNNKSFTSHERFTDVWLKRNGRWQAVSSHSSMLKKK